MMLMASLVRGIIGWNADTGDESKWEFFKASIVIAQEPIVADAIKLPSLASGKTFIITIDENVNKSLAKLMSTRCTGFKIADNKIIIDFVEYEDFAITNWYLTNTRQVNQVTWRHYDHDIENIVFERTFLCKLSNFKTSLSADSDTGVRIELTFDFSL